MDVECVCIFTANRLMENANVVDTSVKLWNRKDNRNAAISAKELSTRDYLCISLL